MEPEIFCDCSIPEETLEILKIYQQDISCKGFAAIKSGILLKAHLKYSHGLSEP